MLLCGLSQRVQQRTTWLKTISRADVLNLTSAEAGHNHPKLYRKLRPRTRQVSRQPQHNQGLAQLLKRSEPCCGRNPTCSMYFLELNFLPVDAPGIEQIFPNIERSLQPRPNLTRIP